MVLLVIYGQAQDGDNFSWPGLVYSQLRTDRATLCLLGTALTGNKGPSCGPFSATLCFLLILQYNMVPNHSAEVRSRVSKCRKAVMCSTAVTCITYAPSRHEHSAVGCEFSASEGEEIPSNACEAAALE